MSQSLFVCAEPGPGARGRFESWLGQAPAALDLNIRRGEPYRRRLQLATPDPAGRIPVIVGGVTEMHRPQDLTGADGIAQVRDFDGNLLLPLQVSVIGLATGGWIQVSADADATNGLPAHLEYPDWSATWQLVLTRGLDRVMPVHGRVRILSDVPLMVNGG